MTNNMPSSILKTAVESQGVTCEKVSVEESWKPKNNYSYRKDQAPRYLALQSLL